MRDIICTYKGNFYILSFAFCVIALIDLPYYTRRIINISMPKISPFDEYKRLKYHKKLCKKSCTGFCAYDFKDHNCDNLNLENPQQGKYYFY